MSKISMSSPNIKQRIEYIKKLSSKAAEVGVLSNTKGVSRDGKTSKLGAAELAAIHCRGALNAGKSKSVIIPARDYQTLAFQNNKEKYAKIIKKAINNGVESKDVFAVIGQMAVADQKLTIRDITPRNAPSTIKAKGKDSPLIDTGHLLKSITSKVVKNDA